MGSQRFSVCGFAASEFTEPAGTEDDEASGYTLFAEAEVELGATLQHLWERKP
jgi:hypothetical protein